VFRSRPALRWLVPSAAAVVIIGGGAAAGTIVASADPSLPDRSAAQLLVDVQNAKVDGFSGTIVESADLGLPAISGLAGGQGGLGDLAGLIAGSNTARVWYAGEDKARVALVGTQGETDVIHNGTDTWLWSSKDNTATHVKGTPDKAKAPLAPHNAGVPQTPQQAAAEALAAIDPTTKVTTTGAARVAGRDAYELVLSPRDTASLVGQVRLAIDAKTHIPLRVDVYAKNATSPAIRVAFQQITFAVPDAQQFAFNPPPGAKVNESTPKVVEQQRKSVEKAARAAKPQLAAEPKVIGKGWTTIVEAKLPSTKADAKSGAKAGNDAGQLSAALNILPKASGSWGTGHIFAGTLFSVLITDEGRVFAGAVAPQSLYAAAAKK
jgi:outer membrane lipoprotein-sorting protein